MAFFTGGTSLLLTIPAVVGTLSGTTCNLITDQVNRSKTKDYIEKIENLVSDIQKLSESLDRTLKDYKESIQWLMKNHNLDENVAIFFTGKLAKSIANISSVIDVAIDGAKLFKAAGDMYATLNTMKSVGTFTRTATGGMSYTITKSVLTSAEEAAIRGFGTMRAVSLTARIFEGALVVVNIGFVVWDIVSLVKDWTRKHPAVEAIDNVTGKLKTIGVQTKENLENFQAIME